MGRFRFLGLVLAYSVVIVLAILSNVAFCYSDLEGPSPGPADSPSTLPSYSNESVEETSDRHANPVVIHMARNGHRAFDKSVAGACIILAGLVAFFLVAIVCYIRATGRKHNKHVDVLDSA